MAEQAIFDFPPHATILGCWYFSDGSADYMAMCWAVDGKIHVVSRTKFYASPQPFDKGDESEVFSANPVEDTPRNRGIFTGKCKIIYGVGVKTLEPELSTEFEGPADVETFQKWLLAQPFCHTRPATPEELAAIKRRMDS